jgi:DNA-binding IclR family transcriptional regulator
MTEHDQSENEVDRFILNEIDTVPHLEALLLLWRNRPRPWSVDEMAKGLFLAPGTTREILRDLMRRGLITSTSEEVPETYHYEPGSAIDSLVSLVDSTYRQELIRLSRLIHAKPSASVREFARAFRIKKEND